MKMQDSSLRVLLLATVSADLPFASVIKLSLPRYA